MSMRAIEAATRHYAENRRQHLDIEEWPVDGKPLRIYWTLPTIGTREKLLGGETSDVQVVVALAEDADGKKMFTAEDKLKLRDQADATILQRIALKMLTGARLTADKIEQAEKN